MAEDFIDDSNLLAVGIRPEEMGMTTGQKISKASFVKTVQEASKEQGGTIGNETLTKIMRNISESIVQKVQQVTLSTTKMVVPSIESELYKIGELLKSSKQDDMELALQLIDKLQERFNVDVRKFNADLGKNIDKLTNALNQSKLQKQQEKEILQNKIKESEIQKQVLKEQGINTIVNQENGKLEVKTFRQEAFEKKSIFEQEKTFLRRKELLLNEEKKLRKQDTLTTFENDKIIRNRQLIQNVEEKLNLKKEKAGIMPSEKPQGPIGEMFSNMKQTFVETLSAPKEMFSGAKSLGNEIASLTKSITPLNKSFNFIGNSVKSLSSSFTSGISTFLKGVKSMGGMGGGGSLLGGAARLLANPYVLGGAAAIGGVAALGYGAKSVYDAHKENPNAAKQNLIEGQYDEMGNPIAGAASPNYEKIKPMRESAPLEKKTLPTADQFTNMNREFITPKEMPNVNNVIAPRNNISNVNQNSTNVITTEISNFDRTYKNLNTVLI